MLEFITVVYLVFMFVAIYFFSFFIILTIRNKKDLFSYPKPNTNFTISVIIPGYNEEDSIQETIDHVTNSDYPKNKMEVIVVNDGSTDNTSKIVKNMMKKYKNLKLIDKKNSGKADSLNQAIKTADGELIAIVDSDSFPEKESLKKLTGYFSNPHMGAVTSFVNVRNKDQNFLAKLQSIEYLIMGWSRKLLDFLNAVYVTNGPLSLYRKSAIEKVGGFDIQTVTEDIDITWNMLYHGYSTSMCLDAKVSTVVPTKLKKWFRQRTRWGLGGLQAIQKYKKIFFKKGMFGIFVLPFVSFSIIVSILTFLFSTYLILRSILIAILATKYSTQARTAILKLEDINYHPSIILFYFIVLFTLSITYSWYVTNKTNYERRLDTKKFFNLLFYTMVYLTTYPVVWFSSIYRFIKKDYRW